MQETRVQFLGWEDPLEEGMATQSNILAWRIPWIEEPGGLQSIVLAVRQDWSDSVCTHTHTHRLEGGTFLWFIISVVKTAHSN